MQERQDQGPTESDAAAAAAEETAGYSTPRSPKSENGLGEGMSKLP